MRLKYFLFVGFCTLACSCRAPKDIVYFQGVDNLTVEKLSEMSQSYSTKITYDDLLSISVAAWDPASVTPFNPPTFAYSTEGDQPLFPSQSLYTYLVDKKGNINFPVLGEMHVIGLTKQELAEKIQKKLADKYVENPLVNVQLLNFKVTMMGELLRPGSYSIKNDRITILDAIGMAGDLPITANRKNILVIRENNEQKEIYRLDITDPAIFASPCFYLKQNDVVYVEPVKNKQRARTSSDRQFSMSLFSTIVSSLSLITTMILSLKKL